MHHYDGHGRQILDQIVPVGHRVHTVRHRPVEVQQFRSVFPVQRICGPGQRAGPQRTVIHPLIDIMQAQAVSLEHFKISSHMMGQRDRLRFLQVGKSRHDRFFIFFHDPQQYLQQILQELISLPHFLSRIQTHVQSHLVVAAPSSMQFLSHVADPADQIRLHETVNILIFIGDLKLSGFHVLQDSLKPFQDPVSFFFRQNSLLRQHLHMSHAALYILSVKFLIERDRRVKPVHQLICLFRKTSAP